MNSLHLLALNALLTALLWMPYVLDRFAKVGVVASMQNPTDDELAKQSEWAKRARRAHANAAENLVVFAPLVLLANDLDVAPELVATAALVHLIARALHYVFATGGVPFVRTLCFLAGFGAQVAVALAIVL